MRRSVLSVVLGAALAAGSSLAAVVPVEADETEVVESEPGKRTEIDDERTEVSKTFQNADGSKTLETYSGPMWVKDTSGEWQDIDTTLVERGGVWEPKVAAVSMAFSDGGQDAFATLDRDGGDSLALGWPEDLPEPTAKGNTLTYPDVVPDGDLVVTALPSGFSHAIVLREAPADPTMQIPLPVELDGTQLREAAGGGLTVTSPDDSAVRVPVPLMWDAEERSDGLPANVERVEAEVTKTAGQTELVLTPDEGMLSDPATQYPVTIDPTFTQESPAQDTFLNSVGPYQDGNVVKNFDSLYSGFDDARTARSYIQFADLNLKDKNLQAAKFSMRNIQSKTCTARVTYAERLTSPWSESTIKWSTNEPSADTTYQPYFTPAAGGPTGCAAHATVDWNVLTSVKAWQDGAKNYGFRVKAATETNANGNSDGWRRYRSSEGNYSGETYHPKLEITYTDKVAVRSGARAGATRLDFTVGDGLSTTVDVGSGNLMMTTDDLKLPAINQDVQLGMVYNSAFVDGTNREGSVGAGGFGWQARLGDDTRLYQRDASDQSNLRNVLYNGPGGLQGTYEDKANSDEYNSPKGFKNKLKKTTDGWTLTDNSSQTKMFFNTDGRLGRIRDRNDQDINFTYSSASPRTVQTVESSRGGTGARKATFTFASGRVTKVAQTGDDGAQRQVSYTYATAAAPVLETLTDTLGRVTRFAYDGNRRLTQVTNTKGKITRFTYDTQGRVLTVTQDPSGINALTRFEWTADENTLVADPKTDPSVAVRTGPHTTYYVSEDSAAGNKELRVRAVEDQVGRMRSKKYTPDYDTASSTDPSGTSTFQYGGPSGNSLTGAESPTGSKSSAEYNNSSPESEYSPSSSTDSQKKKSTMSYSPTSGMQTGNTSAAPDGGTGDTASVDYYADGLPKFSASPGGTLNPSADISDTSANENRTVYRRNEASHQMTQVNTPGTAIGATNLIWDQFGRLRQVEDGRNVTTTYSYDSNDRVTKVDYSGTTPDVEYTYDASGNVASRLDGTGTTTYTYDALERLTQRDAPGAGGVVTYTYDKADNVTGTTDDAGTTSYTYDSANQLKTQTTSGGSLIQFDYDDDGNRTDTWFGTNSSNTTFDAHTKNEYDKSDRITRTWTSKNSSNTDRVFDTSYCYSPYKAGEDCPGAKADTDTGLVQYSVDHLKQTDGRSLYSYDHRNRLTKATNFDGHTYDYTYDADSNIKTIRKDGNLTNDLSHNRVNQILKDSKGTGTADDVDYEYDLAGNRTRVDGEGTMTYDAANRMIELNEEGDSDVAYTYAGTDMKELTRRAVTNGVTFNYTFGRTDNNSQPLVETFTKTGGTGDGRWGIDYDNNGTPMVLRTPSGVEHYFALDRQASAVALINQSGVQSANYTYTPYGAKEVVGNPAEAADINFYRHTLGFTDTGEGTGYTKHGVRWNDTTTGTWTTQDPLNAALDLQDGNRYLYVGGDPINGVDPTGFDRDNGDTLYQVLTLGKACFETGSFGAAGGFIIGTIVFPGIGTGAGSVIGAAGGCQLGLISQGATGQNPFVLPPLGR